MRWLLIHSLRFLERSGALFHFQEILFIFLKLPHETHVRAYDGSLLLCKIQSFPELHAPLFHQVRQNTARASWHSRIAIECIVSTLNLTSERAQTLHNLWHHEWTYNKKWLDVFSREWSYSTAPFKWVWMFSLGASKISILFHLKSYF